MFKNSEDEALFCKVLSAYRQEFGAENLIVFIPRVMAATLPDYIYPPMVIKFWKRPLYSIRVRDMTAGYDLPPND